MWAQTPTTIKENIYADISIEQQQSRSRWLECSNYINNTFDWEQNYIGSSCIRLSNNTLCTLHGVHNAWAEQSLGHFLYTELDLNIITVVFDAQALWGKM